MVDNFALVGDFNVHLGTETAGHVPEATMLKRRSVEYLGYILTTTRHTQYSTTLNMRGKAVVW